MQLARFAFVALTLATTTGVWAGEDESARKLIDKAMAAQGGEAKLTKWQGNTAKFRGTMHIMGQDIPIKGDYAMQGPDRMKIVVNMDVGGNDVTLIQVFVGDKGWNKLNDDTTDMTEDQIAEAKHQAQSNWIATLTPLKDKAFTLTTLGETNIDKKPALGVKVSRTGYRDTKLFFDKESGLLVKVETQVTTDDGEKANQQEFLSDYKEVQGVKQAMKSRTLRNGKPFVETELSEPRLSEKLDDAMFTRP